MRHHDERPGVGGEELLEPGARLQVEVVRRLVQQEDVGTPEQHLGQRGPHLPAAGQLAEVAVQVGVGEAEPVQDGLGLRLHVVAAAVVPFLAHGDVAIHDGCILVALRLDGGELMLELGAALLQRVQIRKGGERVAEDAVAPETQDVLREMPDARAARQRDGPGIGLELARQDAQYRRLAGTVRPGESNAGAVGDAPADLVEHYLRPVALADSGQREHRAG